MTVLDARTVTARKSHVCEDCGRDIMPGEQYRRTTSVGDAGFDTWKCCPQCHALVRDLWDADVRSEDDLGCECYAYLPEVDWADVASWSPLWALRAERWRHQWAGLPYPTDDQEDTDD